MAAKAVEIARAGATGVDKGGGAAGARDLAGIDPERGAAPINMSVQIDEARGDDLAGDTDDFGALARQLRADFRDLTVLKGDIGDFVATICRIDYATAGQDQIRHGSPP